MSALIALTFAKNMRFVEIRTEVTYALERHAKLDLGGMQIH